MSRETDLLRWDLNMERSLQQHGKNGPKVYVAQKRPRFDLTSASEYGRLLTVFREFDQFLDPAASAANMMRTMHNFTDRDHILAIGHPVGLAMLASAAARMNGGRVKMLVWSGDLTRYYSVQMDLGDLVPQRGVSRRGSSAPSNGRRRTTGTWSRSPAPSAHRCDRGP
jgi:hypothetical protein